MVVDGITDKADAAPSPQLGQAAWILLTRKLNAKLGRDLEHLKRLPRCNAKHQKGIGIGRPLGRGLIGGRIQTIRIKTNHKHHDRALGERSQVFRLICAERSSLGNTIGFRPQRRQQPPGDTETQQR